MRDLHAYDLRARFPKYIEQFLSSKRFVVKVQNYPMCTNRQMEYLKEVCLRVTLFAIKINSIAKLIPKNGRFISSLYVDDLQIGYRHMDLQIIREELQQCLDMWTHKNGFKFSLANSKAMYF